MPSPLSSDGTKAAIQRGDDYHNADGRALAWTDTAGAWPELTDAEISLVAAGTSIAGTVVTPTGGSKSVRVDLTAAFTSGLPAMLALPFDLKATLASGRVVTLVEGTFDVSD